MKILVITLAGIGDTLFTTPLIHELRANFPEATIDVLVKEAGARDFLENNPHLNRVHFKDLLKCSQWEGVRFLWGLRSERYDLSINTHPQSKVHYRISAWLAGARMRTSHEYESFRWWDRWLVNRTLPQDYQRHCVENNLATLALAGAVPRLARHELEIFLTPAEESWAQAFLLEQKLAGRPWLGVHVGSGGTKNLALRRWPLENYIALAQRCQTERGLPVLFFGGPEERRDHEQIRQAVPGAIFPPTKNLRQAAALLRSAPAFLSVDTALMHLAAAMRVPHQIVIETPTWNKPIQPFGNPFRLVPNPAIGGRHLEYYRYDGGNIKGSREEIIGL
ncbi:MAG TPA: glycosyltransferase family 9 protein, partial [Verrucomicrobiae bacterium]